MKKCEAFYLKIYFFNLTSVNHMKTKIIFLSTIFGLLSTQLYAQSRLYANTAFQLSDMTQNGTARVQGMGGNHAALGGDASNSFGNPAGLGFYNRSEFSLSPGLYINNRQANYIDNTTTDGKTTPNVGQFSLILAGEPRNNYNNDWRRTTMGISYSRQVNANTAFSYGGTNNRSSIIDNITQLAGNVSTRTLEDDFNGRSNSAFSIESAFYNLYLIDALSDNGPYRRPVPLSRASFQQSGNYELTGGSSQWTFAYAGNYQDKLYLGFSGGFARHNFVRRSELQERFVNGGAFESLGYREDVTITGSGLFVSVGAIYRANDFLQIGASIHSPNFSSLQMTYEENVRVSVPSGRVPVFDASGRPVTNAQGQQAFDQIATSAVRVEPFNFEYNMRTPFRAQGGVTFFAGKKGLITASAEYVGYRGMSMSIPDDANFKTDNRSIVRTSFNNVVNLRAGGELRLNNLRVRAGAGFLPNPYNQNYNIEGSLDRSKLYFSGGLGYRNDRFFVDLAGTYLTTKDAFAPYTLNNASNYFSAQLDVKAISAVVSAGVFF
jgi:hypothetical protein